MSWLEMQGPGPHTRARLSIAKVLGQLHSWGNALLKVGHMTNQRPTSTISPPYRCRTLSEAMPKLETLVLTQPGGVESREGTFFSLRRAFPQKLDALTLSCPEPQHSGH